MTKKCIGVLTSGGDCAGLNACIRSIVIHAISDYGWDVIGICKGTSGLVSRPMEVVSLTEEMCSTEMMRRGGTILGSTNQGICVFNADGSPSQYALDFAEGYHSF